MDSRQKRIISENTEDLVDGMTAIAALPYLDCLTQHEREAVRCRNDQEGNCKAVTKLLDAVERKREGFEQLLLALENTGCEYLARDLKKHYGEYQRRGNLVDNFNCGVLKDFRKVNWVWTEK